MVLIWPCDRLLQLWPLISLAKYVDDLGVSMLDKQKEVAAVLPAPVGQLVSMLEDGLDLPVSRDGPGLPKGKSIALASHCGLALKLGRPLSKYGIRLEA